MALLNQYARQKRKSIEMDEKGILDRLIKTPDWFESPQAKYPDVASVVRRTFVNVEEAEDYAKLLGVDADYEQRLDIAQLANEFLARLNDRGAALPLTVMVNSAYFAVKFPMDIEQIAAMGDQGAILINPAGQLWRNPVLSTRLLFRSREWSTPSPLHVFFHEYAHLQQKEETRQKALTPRQKTVVHPVSIRARRNVEEFLAEVYAGLVEGVQYDPDIMRLYRYYGGLQR